MNGNKYSIGYPKVMYLKYTKLSVTQIKSCVRVVSSLKTSGKCMKCHLIQIHNAVAQYESKYSSMDQDFFWNVGFKNFEFA